MAKPVDGDWYNGSPESLPPLVSRLEGALSPGRFIDGAITRMYYGQQWMPTGAPLPSSGVLPASAYIVALAAYTEENVMASVLGAAVSMILRKPAFKLITEGSKWRRNRAARRMSRLMTGVYTTSGLEDCTENVVLDSMRCQVAASKWVMSPQGRLTCWRKLPHTIVWNPAEGPNPRNIYEHDGVPRARLMRQLPELADEIKRNGAPYRPDPAFHVDTYLGHQDRDLVEVVEGWRKAEDDDMGRHVMFVTGLREAVVDEEWDMPLWPIVPLTWGQSYDTLAGYPLGRLVLPFQRTLNRMDRTIDEAQAKACMPKLLVPKGAEVTGWDNSIGGRVDYNAAAGTPTIVPGQALPPEYYKRFADKKSAAYELPGISQSVAQGTKVDGVASARGQRDIYDIANSRLVQNAQRIERWFGDNAQVAGALMKREYGKGKKARAKAPNTALIDEIDWDEIGDPREDAVEWRAFITSSIPVTPSGRDEALAERVSNGVMTQAQVNRWYADPDVARLEDEDSATEDLVRKLVESALDDGVYLAPEPLLGPEGLAMVVSIGSKDYLEALTMEEPPPDAHLELLRRLIEEAKLMIAPPPTPAPSTPQLAPPPGMGAPPMTPIGAPVGAPGEVPPFGAVPPPAM